MMKIRTAIPLFIPLLVLQACSEGASPEDQTNAQAAQSLVSETGIKSFSVQLKNVVVRRISNSDPVPVAVIGVNAEDLSWQE